MNVLISRALIPSSIESRIKSEIPHIHQITTHEETEINAPEIVGTERKVTPYEVEDIRTLVLSVDGVVRINDKQGALYVVSNGKDEVRTKLPNGTPLPMPTPWAYAHTGVVWKIMKTGGSAAVNTTTTTGSTIENSTKKATKVPGLP